MLALDRSDRPSSPPPSGDDAPPPSPSGPVDPTDPAHPTTNRPEPSRASALGEPALRAALLALGTGLVWVALAAHRRRRPTDLW